MFIYSFCKVILKNFLIFLHFHSSVLPYVLSFYNYTHLQSTSPIYTSTYYNANYTLILL